MELPGICPRHVRASSQLAGHDMGVRRIQDDGAGGWRLEASHRNAMQQCDKKQFGDAASTQSSWRLSLLHGGLLAVQQLGKVNLVANLKLLKVEGCLQVHC